MQQIQYTIDCHDFLHKRLKVQLEIGLDKNGMLELELAAWRPGRYQIANFAKNLYRLDATNEQGDLLSIKKTALHKWEIETGESKSITLKYEYFAGKLDAGSSYLAEDFILLNPINFLIFPSEAKQSGIFVALSSPKNMLWECALDREGHLWYAKDISKLLDSPFLGAYQFEKHSYTHGESKFHVVSYNPLKVNMESLYGSFELFTKGCLEIFGTLPSTNYYFLNLLLNLPIYHGVEHANSTVIALGKSGGNQDSEFLDNILGISCHELFHAWNVCRIRPAEFLEYNFGKEILTEAGFILEGFTTYYGDLMLVRSGVWSKERYLQELENLLNRHADQENIGGISLIDSSIDLWLDGYEPGATNRKVSIYTKGGILALLLDLAIIENSKGHESLDDVCRFLWVSFYMKGKGYTIQEVLRKIVEIGGFKTQKLIDEILYGTSPGWEEINLLLEKVGVGMVRVESLDVLERFLGVKTIPGQNGLRVVHPGKIRHKNGKLALYDEIISINGQVINDLKNISWEEPLNVLVWRDGKQITIETKVVDFENGFPKVKLKLEEQLDKEEQSRLDFWLGRRVKEKRY